MWKYCTDMKKGITVITLILATCSIALSQSKEEQDLFFLNLIQETQTPQKTSTTISSNISLNYRQEDGFGGNVGISISNPRNLFASDIYISSKLSMGFNAKGHHYFKKVDSRLEYSISGYKNNRYYWGTGYENGINMEKALYTQMGIKANVGYRLYLINNLELTPMINYELFKTKDLADNEYSNHFYFGMNFLYDSRNKLTNPDKGLMISFTQKIYPNYIINSEGFFQTKFIADLFIPVWKDGVMAIDLFCESNYGEVPWYLWTPIGGEVRMRGYYYGRYRDKNSVVAQLELRQKIYNNHGLVVWGGAGYIFPSLSDFSFRNILPNCGIGYRLDTSSGLMRVDVGFGKTGEWGIIAGFNHAF